MEADPFPKHCVLLEYQAMDKVQEASNPEFFYVFSFLDTTCFEETIELSEHPHLE
jgi:hypothetical protein